MLTINKITSASPVDFAAEELKKYLRMMMPEGGDIKVSYAPEAKDGFRLGLMQDFGLDTSDALDTELDDILYIDTDCEGGIIAGDNPRSVLLAVYEYLRQNGCRWLFPGVDGEFIPMQDVVPVKYRHKPSCRYRGWCNEGAEFQESMIQTIDFSPKVGNNVFMMEFRIPSAYYDCYYSHRGNSENRKPEPVSDMQVLQWKRQCESEIEKRGLQFHDIGHGWTVDPFGVDSARCWAQIDDSYLSDEDRSMLAYTILKRKAGGAGMPSEEEIKTAPRARGLWNGQPLNTNFCMSNVKARRKFVDYVTSDAEGHSNSTYLHVWLGDAANNHCECEECKKKTPSDWYMILMNECDSELTKRNLNTRIVFIAYVDTTWAPTTEKITNQDRFTLLLAPITRSYTVTLPEGDITQKTVPYKRNQNALPSSLEEYFAYFEEWKKTWKGANLTYEYHFWRHQAFDLSGIELSKRINEDIKVYKAYDVDGVIEDGSQRSFFPTGLAFYTYARTLFDTSLSADEIAEDYFSHAFGEDWRKFYDYLKMLEEKIPFPYVSGNYVNRHYAPDMREQILSVKKVIEDGRRIIGEHYNSDMRVQTYSVRLLEMHTDYCDMLSDALAEKCVGNDKAAKELFEKLRIEMGRREAEFALVYDHLLIMYAVESIIFAKATEEPVLLL